MLKRKSRSRSKSSKRQTCITEYFAGQNQTASMKWRVLCSKQGLSFTKCARLYRFNNIKQSDIVHTPLGLLVFVHDLAVRFVKDVYIKDNALMDITPFCCDKDNYNYMLWSTMNINFLNMPFSGSNCKQWFIEASKFVSERGGTIFIIAPVGCLSTRYVAKHLYENVKVDCRVWSLIKNFGFRHVPNRKYGKSLRFGIVVLLLKPNLGGHISETMVKQSKVCHQMENVACKYYNVDIIKFWENPQNIKRRKDLVKRVRKMIHLNREYYRKISGI